MGISEPRVRQRGFFFHVEPRSVDQVEYEAAEGVSIRLGSTRKPTHAIRTTSLSQPREQTQKGRSGAGFRSASGTGTHRQARMSR
jgi:hypothetical protein